MPVNEKCFGLGSHNKCTILKEEYCCGYAHCAFYKPKWQAEADREAANARLRELPMDEQKAIAEKYHNGSMTWYNEKGGAE